MAPADAICLLESRLRWRASMSKISPRCNSESGLLVVDMPPRLARVIKIVRLDVPAQPPAIKIGGSRDRPRRSLDEDSFRLPVSGSVSTRFVSKESNVIN